MKISKKLNHDVRIKLLFFIPFFIIFGIVMLEYQTTCELGGRLVSPVSLETFIDNFIPFNIYIIYPYFLCIWYVLFSGIIYTFYRKINVVHFISFYTSVIIMYLICYSIYIVFPTSAQSVMITTFDPHILNQGMYNALQTLYKASTPLGDFPSLHVAPLVFMGIFLYKHWRLFFWIFLPFAFLGAIGTVLLKFHTFLGIAGGIILGLFGYYILYEKIILKYFSKNIIEKD